MTDVLMLMLFMLGMRRGRRPGKKEDARPDEPVVRSQPNPLEHRYARRRLGYASAVAQRPYVSSPSGTTHNRPPKLTAEQEADLIERGLPERLVRNGNLDYASLTSGSMSDRMRNGCC